MERVNDCIFPYEREVNHSIGEPSHRMSAVNRWLGADVLQTRYQLQIRSLVSLEALEKPLGDVFIESALGERKNTFLLETHSEHLILRILRRVRETTEGKLESGKTAVCPEDVTVMFVEPTAKGSVLRHLPVTPDGDLGASWPGGFFAERFKDLP